MILDLLFPQSLRNYIVEMTSPEPALLANLQQETQQRFGEQVRMLTGVVEGMLLQFLVSISGAKRCLEVGTFTGYSALNIASALPTDGKLITCEIRKENANIAQKYFNLSPHGHKIELCLGDALQTAQNLSGAFDFIFLDANQSQYPLYYDLLIPKLRVGGLMIVDNALWGGEIISPQDKYAKAIDTLNMKARQDPQVETVMLSVRDGILLILKR